MAQVGYIRVSSTDQNVERQREGIELAKAAGKYKGRKPVANAELRARIDRMLESGKSKAEVAAELGISRTTLYKCLSM